MDNRLHEIFPVESSNMKFMIVVEDYFTKWVEVEHFVNIIETNTCKFIWKNIIYRFGVSNSIISNKETQFQVKKLKIIYDELGIRRHFSTPYYSQANEQLEAVTKY